MAEKEGVPYNAYASSTCCDLSPYTTGSEADTRSRAPSVSPIGKKLFKKRTTSSKKKESVPTSQESDKASDDGSKISVLRHILQEPKQGRRSVGLEAQHTQPTIQFVDSKVANQVDAKGSRARGNQAIVIDSDLEFSENETEDQINETILRLGPIESIHYAVRKLRNNGKAIPGGWSEFIRCREMGSDPWVAANLPRCPLTGNAKFYSDVMYYSYGMEPVKWMDYYSTILEKQRQYKWSALQMGVVLATYIHGAMMQTLTNELTGDKIIYITYITC